ncbi:hypothetical protein TRFO_27181 [Tritrichomonas foetus]|uniref:Uncharacterized protein n=1 Tax=Tritrichomonas foetus TaxID=1144522 RepID=A0A1J4K643_9EUKA|nr:hypothetical protein TRFO_27181 [Tritrichomonas foetus]|eukprot:OHT05172.1 hypothetical protein TRFO_27181 [Tritrichomonas foetus]
MFENFTKCENGKTFREVASDIFHNIIHNIISPNIFKDPNLPLLFERDNDVPITYYPPVVNLFKGGSIYKTKFTPDPGLFLMFSIVPYDGEPLGKLFKLIIENYPHQINGYTYDGRENTNLFYKVRSTDIEIPFKFGFGTSNGPRDNIFVIVQGVRVRSLESLKDLIVWSRYQKIEGNPYLICKCYRCNHFTFDFISIPDAVIYNGICCPICKKIMDISQIIIENLTPLPKQIPGQISPANKSVPPMSVPYKHQIPMNQDKNPNMNSDMNSNLDQNINQSINKNLNNNMSQNMNLNMNQIRQNMPQEVQSQSEVPMPGIQMQQQRQMQMQTKQQQGQYSQNYTPQQITPQQMPLPKIPQLVPHPQINRPIPTQPNPASIKITDFMCSFIMMDSNVEQWITDTSFPGNHLEAPELNPMLFETPEDYAEVTDDIIGSYYCI